MSPDDTLPAFPVQDGVQFRHCPGFPGYCVGDDGSLWSCRVWGHANLLGRWHTLSPSLSKFGYLRLRLGPKTGRKTLRVHRLVLEAFVGPCPAGMESRHLNGNALDNRLANLAWGTPEQNFADRLIHGTVVTRETCPGRKLSEADILVICEMFNGGALLKDIAARFGIDPSYTGKILRGKWWGDVMPCVPPLAGKDARSRGAKAREEARRRGKS